MALNNVTVIDSEANLTAKVRIEGYYNQIVKLNIDVDGQYLGSFVLDHKKKKYEKITFMNGGLSLTMNKVFTVIPSFSLNGQITVDLEYNLNDGTGIKTYCATLYNWTRNQKTS